MTYGDALEALPRLKRFSSRHPQLAEAIFDSAALRCEAVQLPQTDDLRDLVEDDIVAGVVEDVAEHPFRSIISAVIIAIIAKLIVEWLLSVIK